MAANTTETKQHAHQLLDQLAPVQVAAVVQLLEVIVDPDREDEQISEGEKQAVGRSKEWFKSNSGTVLEDVVSELGFTMDQIRHNKERL